jgi:electron transport complex protein RnfG
MKQSIKMISSLCLIAVISAIVLAKVYMITLPAITANEKEATERAIYKVVDTAASYKESKSGETDIFKCYDKDNKLCGLAFIAEGVGYQDIIKVMVGVSTDFNKILAIEVIENSETPGLGNRIVTPWFENQFQNLSLQDKITVVKETPSKGSEIQAITGATISSQAVVDIINKEIEKLKKSK